MFQFFGVRTGYGKGDVLATSDNLADLTVEGRFNKMKNMDRPHVSQDEALRNTS